MSDIVFFQLFQQAYVEVISILTKNFLVPETKSSDLTKPGKHIHFWTFGLFKVYLLFPNENLI